jgi:5S rRNA maturation endonuclease (ribonuclease M5)
MKGGEPTVKVRGIVIPVDWDEKGKVIAAAVSTDTEDEYLIDHDHKGKELLHYIQEEVEVSGVARKHNGNKTITITKYSLKKS